MEHTFILIKPDGVHLGLAGRIMSKFDNKGFTLKGLKMITVDRLFAEKHHQDVSANLYFSSIVDYTISGPVVAMIWEGKNVVLRARNIIQKTIPRASDMDTDRGSNLIHVSVSSERAHKDISLWFPDGPVKLPSDAAIPKARDIGRISVRGFDTGSDHEDIESALRKHYGSCGKITDVYIHELTCVAYIYLVGEDAVDKALKLNGCEVGGWNVRAKAYPFRDDKPVLVTVEGYSTSLSADDIESAVRDLLSSCGEVTKVRINKSFTTVYIKGFDAAEKAPKLSGSIIGRRKVLVKNLTEPPRCTVHNRRRLVINPPRPAGFNDFARIQKR